MTASEAERGLVEARIERGREELREAVSGLGDTVVASFDPRKRIRERPVTWLLGGFLVGWFLGRRSASRRI